MNDDVDSILESIGGPCSRWHITTYFSYAFGFSLPLAWTSLLVIFTADTPYYHCLIPLNNYTSLNDTIPWIIKSSQDVAKDHNYQLKDINNTTNYPGISTRRSQCTQYIYDNYTYSNDVTTSCQDGYWFDSKSGYVSTIVTEWELVCNSSWLAELAMTVAGVGGAIGSVLYSKAADCWGRRPIYLGCMWLCIICTLLQAFSTNYTTYLLLRLIYGIHQQGMTSASSILVLEMFPSEHRTMAGCVIELFWVFGYITLTPVVYLVRDWRTLHFVVTLPLLLSVILYRYTPESIPWLLANGRKKEVEEILRKASSMNNTSINSHAIDSHLSQGRLSHEVSTAVASQSNCDVEPLIEDPSEISRDSDHMYSSLTDPTNYVPGPYNDSRVLDGSTSHITLTIKNKWDRLMTSKKNRTKTEHQYGIRDLIASKTLRSYTIYLSLIWFVNFLVYYSLNYMVTMLSGNRYLTFLLYGLVELPAYLVTWFTLHRYGRRRPLCTFHLLCGVALIATLIENIKSSDLTWLVISLSLIGKFAISAAFASIILYSPEIFPTNIRNTGVGICQVFGRFGAFIAPFFREIRRGSGLLTPLVLGAVSILAGVAMFLMPETRHVPMPETIAEVESWPRSTDRSSTQNRQLPDGSLDDRLLANIGTSESAYSVESTMVI